jgi:predicted RNA-binding Zn ribbon-like protein
MPAPLDPRPLTGEPLPLDLVNTEWKTEGERHDLLADVSGLRRWLRASGHKAEATKESLAALRASREAIRGLLAHADDAAAREALNAILAAGHWQRRLGPGGPEHRLVTTTEDQRLAWEAASQFLDLLDTQPERVRGCANHDCILYFHDSSRGGHRQWCSMATCGNRAKARRHYLRTRPS